MGSSESKTTERICEHESDRSLDDIHEDVSVVAARLKRASVIANEMGEDYLPWQRGIAYRLFLKEFLW